MHSTKWHIIYNSKVPVVGEGFKEELTNLGPWRAKRKQKLRVSGILGVPS